MTAEVKKDKWLWFLAVLTAGLPFLRMTILNQVSATLYYIMLLLMAAGTVTYSIRNHRTVHPDLMILFFLAVCALSIGWNYVAQQFHSWYRLGAFTLLLTVAGPLVMSHRLRRWRQLTLQIVMWGCVACAVYYNGLYIFMLTHYCSWLSRYSYVWWHSLHIAMLTGALSGLATLFIGYRLMQRPAAWKSGIPLCNRLKIWGEYILFLLSLNALLLASSRTAIVAFAAAWILLCISKLNQNQGGWKVSCRKSLTQIVPIFTVCVFSVTMPLTPIMESKFRYITAEGSDYLASRRQLWSEREQEISQHRLFGTGFASVDASSARSSNKTLKIQHTLNANESAGAEITDGRVEPGSGWMYVLSSTGIVGFILFLTIYLRGVLSSLFSRRNFPALVLLYIGLHMVTEGYPLASGAVMCFIYWLTLGCAGVKVKLPLSRLKKEVRWRVIKFI